MRLYLSSSICITSHGRMFWVSFMLSKKDTCSLFRDEEHFLCFSSSAEECDCFHFLAIVQTQACYLNYSKWIFKICSAPVVCHSASPKVLLNMTTHMVTQRQSVHQNVHAPCYCDHGICGAEGVWSRDMWISPWQERFERDFYNIFLLDYM